MRGSSIRDQAVWAVYGALLGVGLVIFFWQRDSAEAQPRNAGGPVATKTDIGGDARAIEAAIRAVLDAQLQAWNSGDIDAFMEHYWKSDELTFSSGGKTTRSWQATLARYKERYPTRAAMGETTFKNLEFTPLGDAAALVLGEWQLRREAETMGGNFSLVLRRIDGKWMIIHDHTSLAAAP